MPRDQERSRPGGRAALQGDHQASGININGSPTDRPLTRAEADALFDRIRSHIEQGYELIIEAYRRGAWLAAGYSTWEECCVEEFGTDRIRIPISERPAVVSLMAGADMSLREIAVATGLSKSAVSREVSRSRSVPSGTDDDLVQAAEREVEAARLEWNAAVDELHDYPVRTRKPEYSRSEYAEITAGAWERWTSMRRAFARKLLAIWDVVDTVEREGCTESYFAGKHLPDVDEKVKELTSECLRFATGVIEEQNDDPVVLRALELLRRKGGVPVDSLLDASADSEDPWTAEFARRNAYRAKVRAHLAGGS